MKKKTSYYVLSLIGLLIIATFASCHNPIYERQSKNFIYLIFNPISKLTINEQPVIGDVYNYNNTPLVLKCKKEGDKLIGQSYLQFEGHEGGISYEISNELNDKEYYRVVTKNYFYNVDREKKRYNKYYIPNMPIYWNYNKISITSENANFGEEYPIGSDLTPLVVFKFSSLKEFIDNQYKGPYTTEHIIRANDETGWKNLLLFENLIKMNIDKVPTSVKGEGKPSITLSIQFVDKSNCKKSGTNDSSLCETKTIKAIIFLDIK